MPGLFAHCRTVRYMAMFGAPIGGDWGGLFSDVVRVPYADAMLVPLPPGLDPVAMASASDNWSLAWRLVAPHLMTKPGGAVLIMNSGSIGLYACDIAGALGASRRLFVDPDPERRAIAESYGAETAESIDAIHHGFDIAVETTGRVDALACACRSLVPGDHLALPAASERRRVAKQEADRHLRDFGDRREFLVDHAKYLATLRRDRRGRARG
jgi:alcohol dehydrogenase